MKFRATLRRLAATPGICFLLVATAAAQTNAPEAPAPASTPAPATAPPASIADQARIAQQNASGPIAPFHIQMPHSRNPIAPYRPSTVPELNLANSPRLQQLIREGKLYLSLRDAIALALENNLDLAYFRYNLPISDTDLARTKAGGTTRGVNTSVQQGTPGGFGGTPSGASGTGGGGNAGGAGGLVQSTLGSGTAVSSFDPQFYAQGLVDHTVEQLVNTVQLGVPIYKQNTVEFISQYSQAFPLGTNLQFSYTGTRQTANTPFDITNPTLSSNFVFLVNQPLLAGFGLGTNERYIHIAKKNKDLTDLGFKAQTIATITVVENIYWDLMNTYQDEQVKERSLAFAQKTLDDDQKELNLQAIPAMQVLKDESDVATREGDLTVAKAALKLNELLMKNALTKEIDDPALADMPVVPLDREGPQNDNEGKPVDGLIAEAEKNRPDVAADQISMQIAESSLKSIKNSLLPALSLYGEYAGSSTGGPLNPNCGLGSNCTTSLPTDFPGILKNSFNYSSPEYQVGFKLIFTLRNRIAKADQFRAVLEFRQDQLTFEQQKKNIRFDVRNSQFALQQARARVDSARKARDLAQKTFDITKQEQQLGAKSSFDTLSSEHDLAVAESTLVSAQAAYEKAKVDIDRATGETLDRMGVSIDDARSGVVSRAPLGN